MRSTTSAQDRALSQIKTIQIEDMTGNSHNTLKPTEVALRYLPSATLQLRRSGDRANANTIYTD